MRHSFFCTECQKETGYTVSSVEIQRSILDKEYRFVIMRGCCDKCGQQLFLPGMIDRNARAVDRQYRQAEAIILREEIEKLLLVYQMDKTTLSLALGFDEVTFSNYLKGLVPTRQHSDVMLKALESTDFMLQCCFCNLPNKIWITIAYIFQKVHKITPLALQKLLYYIQAFYLMQYEIPLFEEECQAWAHGPVFVSVYEVFKKYKYNPIVNIEASMHMGKLEECEKVIIDQVINTFGCYSGKVLEKITHQETPWKEARAHCLPMQRSHEVITKESIKQYFHEMRTVYELQSEKGIMEYIQEGITGRR